MSVAEDYGKNDSSVFSESESRLLKFLLDHLKTKKTDGLPLLGSCATSEKPRYLRIQNELHDTLTGNVHADGHLKTPNRSDYLRPLETIWLYYLVPDGRIYRAAEMIKNATVESEQAKLAGIQREDGSKISYFDFVSKYMAKNKPAVLTNLANDWLISKKSSEGGWLTETLDCVDIDDLERRYKSVQVPIQYAYDEDGASCCVCQDHSRLTRATSHIPFCEFARLWRGGCTHTYLKDWHLFLNVEGNESLHVPGNMAPIPRLFADDWMNDFLPKIGKGKGLQKTKTDYRFVYLGRKGTKTKLHADVLNSYSWSTNVCGTKRWLFLSPEQTHLLYDCFGKNVAPDFYSQDELLFPRLNEVKPIELIQRQGETVFVPSGWYHTVENIEDTLSVNANWCNAYNLVWCLARLEKNFELWRTACQQAILGSRPNQKVVSQPATFDCEDFITMLKYKIRNVSIELTEKSTPSSSIEYIKDKGSTVEKPGPGVDVFQLKKLQLLYDLRQAALVLHNLIIIFGRESLSENAYIEANQAISEAREQLFCHGYEFKPFELCLGNAR